MTFLNSALLFALSAVSIPLIIHFLSKRRIKTIEFSSLRFLEQMQKSRMKWLKIKELILLILRMLIIALIVMAFARPTLRGFVGTSKSSSSVAVIIDRSGSMDNEGETGTIFDEAKRIAGKLLSFFSPGDQITVIASPGDGSLISYGPMNPSDALKQKLGKIDLGYQKGNIGDALKTALNTVGKSIDLNREIYIISDFQSNGWDNLPPDVLNRSTWNNIHLFTISPKMSTRENIGITDVSLPSQLLIPGENFDIEAQLTNYGKGIVENVLVGVVVDGDRKAQSSIALPPNQPVKLRFTLKLDSPGDHSGYIETDYDRFPLDNRRYFSVHIPDKISVLAIAQDVAALRYISMAMDRPEAGQISYKGASIADLIRYNLNDYNALLLQDIKSLDPSQEASIQRFIDSGGGVLLSLGKLSDQIYWNKFLQKIAGISIGQLSGKDGEFLNWDKFDYEHPIFSIYSPNNQDRTKPVIPELKITYYHQINGGKIIGSSSSGVALLAESTKNHLIVYSSGFDIESGELPTHSFYIPLLARSIEYIGSHNSEDSFNGIIGETAQWKLPANITDNLTIVSPDNKIENLQSIPSGNNTMIKLTEYGQPGIYTLKNNDKDLALLAFNIDPSESDNSTITVSEIGERLGVDIKEISPDSDLKTTIRQARFGKELWKEFLLLALILLVVESILGRTSPLMAKNKGQAGND